MLFRTPDLTEAERRVHKAIEDLREKLNWSISSRRWSGLLRRVAFAKAIRGSNSIEGYNVTVDDALAAVDGEKPLDAEGETWEAVVGYRKAMTYALTLSDDQHFEYSAALLKGLHYTMTSYDLARHPGRWRPGPVFVRNETTKERVYEAPDVELVPSLVDELVRKQNEISSAPVMIRAAMAHLNLVMIHPFSDGNGRMARCLQSLVLGRSGILAPEFCSIEEYLGRNTDDYYNVLATVGAGSWHPERDAMPWIRFCLAAHYVQAVTLLRRSREFQRIWDALESLISHHALPERTIYALCDATQGFRVSNGGYRDVAEISQNLASRDLAHLAALGLLQAHGERRGRYYTASPVTAEVRRQTREPRIQIPNPFMSESLAETPPLALLAAPPD